jgi:hypothetical protein
LYGFVNLKRKKETMPVLKRKLGFGFYQKIHEEGPIQVLGQLVEDEPVAPAALEHVVVDLVHVGVALEVAVHPQVQQLEPQPGRVDLHNPEDEAEEAQEDQDEEPPGKPGKMNNYV